MGICNSSRSAGIVLSCAALIASGCVGKKPPAPLMVPAAQAILTHFNGTPLSGPLGKAAPVTPPENALAISVRMISVADITPDELAPLSVRARMIAVTRSSEPVVAVPKITDRARFATSQPAETFISRVQELPETQRAEIHAFTDALPPGVTSEFGLMSQSTPDLRGFTLQLHRPESRPTTLQIALSVQDQVIPDEPNSADEGSTTKPTAAIKRQPVTQREMILIDDLADAESMKGVIYLPFQFAQASGRAVVIEISTSNGSADDAVHRQALAQTQSDLQKSAAEVAGLSGAAPTGSSLASGLSTAIIAMQQPQTRRSAMLFLASQNNAPLLEDLALVGDDSPLESVAAQIAAHPPQISVTDSAIDAGWALETVALTEIVALQSNGKLAPPLQSVVMRLYGEAGRNPSSLQEIAKGPPSRAEFQNRLVAENLIYLEDNSPSARIRAYDWLAARGLAPKGYEPLGPIRERRDALEKALYSPAPTTQGGAR